MLAETQEDKEARWKKDWDNQLAGARSGNPYAGMCDHCMGKHKPPRNNECPHPKFERK